MGSVSQESSPFQCMRIWQIFTPQSGMVCQRGLMMRALSQLGSGPIRRTAHCTSQKMRRRHGLRVLEID
ncbi:hypothetical protein FGO68_gene16999 [Halteria grandinella]|uniref:Uncharacterized protein n=1 Tax=Halteria grandinella TaxID=5974 RepID=A0A8J8P2B4_HALGN|nr:hypothetical protein FGO68_gene16999 [Halteria grandinella]